MRQVGSLLKLAAQAHHYQDVAQMVSGPSIALGSTGLWLSRAHYCVRSCFFCILCYVEPPITQRGKVLAFARSSERLFRGLILPRFSHHRRFHQKGSRDISNNISAALSRQNLD